MFEFCLLVVLILLSFVLTWPVPAPQLGLHKCGGRVCRQLQRHVDCLNAAPPGLGLPGGPAWRGTGDAGRSPRAPLAPARHRPPRQAGTASRRSGLLRLEGRRARSSRRQDHSLWLKLWVCHCCGVKGCGNGSHKYRDASRVCQTICARPGRRTEWWTSCNRPAHRSRLS